MSVPLPPPPHLFSRNQCYLVERLYMHIHLYIQLFGWLVRRSVGPLVRWSVCHKVVLKVLKNVLKTFKRFKGINKNLLANSKVILKTFVCLPVCFFDFLRKCRRTRLRSNDLVCSALWSQSVQFSIRLSQPFFLLLCTAL